MKFCLDCRLSPQYLKQADQIRVQPRDNNYIANLIEEYPDKDIVLVVAEIPTMEDIEEWQKWNKLSGGHLILAFNYYPQPEQYGNCRWYANYPVESFSEAQALIAQGSMCLRLGSPLAFMIDKVALLKVQVRLVPNQPYLSLVPRDDAGIMGQWIRPEDVYLYERLHDPIMEFDFCRVSEEEALYRIYAEQHNWPGPMSMIIQGLEDDALNRLMPKELGEQRLNCGHKCYDPSATCRVCPNAFKLAKMLYYKHNFDKA